MMTNKSLIKFATTTALALAINVFAVSDGWCMQNSVVADTSDSNRTFPSVRQASNGGVAVDDDGDAAADNQLYFAAQGEVEAYKERMALIQEELNFEKKTTDNFAARLRGLMNEKRANEARMKQLVAKLDPHSSSATQSQTSLSPEEPNGPSTAQQVALLSAVVAGNSSTSSSLAAKPDDLFTALETRTLALQAELDKEKKLAGELELKLSNLLADQKAAEAAREQKKRQWEEAQKTAAQDRTRWLQVETAALRAKLKARQEGFQDLDVEG